MSARPPAHSSSDGRRGVGRSAVAGLACLCPLAGAAALSDPTRPADYLPAAAPVEIPADVLNWTVSGITISPWGRSAIVNDRVVVPGRRVGGATVLEVLPRAVVFDYEGERVTIEFLPGAVKRPAQAPVPEASQ